jgi:hypothetical protein
VAIGLVVAIFALAVHSGVSPNELGLMSAYYHPDNGQRRKRKGQRIGQVGVPGANSSPTERQNNAQCDGEQQSQRFYDVIYRSLGRQLCSIGSRLSRHGGGRVHRERTN